MRNIWYTETLDEIEPMPLCLVQVAPYSSPATGELWEVRVVLPLISLTKQSAPQSNFRRNEMPASTFGKVKTCYCGRWRGVVCHLLPTRRSRTPDAPQTANRMQVGKLALQLIIRFPRRSVAATAASHRTLDSALLFRYMDSLSLDAN